MFSQWRQAVETLAQVPSLHSPKPSQDATGSAARSSSESLRPSTSSASLAEPALSSLKKSLAAQRPASPSPVQPKPSTSEQSTGRSPGHRTTLEDRLRAKFAIGDASNTTTPNTSSRPSRSSTPVTDHPLSPSPSSRPQSPDVKAGPPLSPKSTPLPNSPILNATIDSLELVVPERVASPLGVEPTAIPVVNGDVRTEDDTIPPAEVTEKPVDEQLPHISVDPMTPAEVSMESDSQAERPPSEVLEDHIAELEAAAEPEASPEPSTESVDVGSGKENVEEESTPFIATSEDIGEAEAIEPSVPDEVSAPADTPPEPTTSTESVPDATLHADATAAPATIEIISPPALAPLISPSKTDESDIEALQQRLKLVEQRFADVSTSFKRLQAEKAAADLVLREFTPLESMQDTEALNDYLQNMNLKNEMAQDEIRRLTGKLTRKVLSSAKPEFEADSDAIGQDERIEELRDTHHLESKSQSDQIEKLRAQRDESEALLKASQATQSEAVEEAKRKKAELDALHLEVEKVKNTGKEEEEKRVKAIALLKTVRQKLVKAEKERDDATRELHTLREKERDERDKFQEEKQNLLADIETVNHERETAIVGLRSQFDRELTAVKERHEKEQLALRGQYELEAVTTKALYTKELEAKTSRVAQLESIVQTLRTDKDDLFDQLQMRQAELESSRHLQETLQSQSSEFQYQIRESTERIALLQDELAETQRSHAFGVHSPSASADEVSRLLLEAEAKYESRLAEFRRQLSDIERERDEGEADWSRKLVEKVKEIDALKRTVSQSLRSEDDERERMYNLKEEITRLKEELRVSQVLISDLKGQAGKIGDVEATVRSQLADANSKANALQQQLEEFQSREAQLKANNKTLRDELRKVQSSAALLERQRNPGVGYWAARPDGSSETRSPRSSVSDLQSPNGQTSRPGSPAGPSKSDEEVNFEYLRNVILQFLEHQEMRPHLVRILSTILHFTPQETRRLVSKVS